MYKWIVVIGGIIIIIVLILIRLFKIEEEEWNKKCSPETKTIIEGELKDE